MDIGAVSTSWLLWIELLWTCVYIYLSDYLFSVLLGICLAVELFILITWARYLIYLLHPYYFIPNLREILEDCVNIFSTESALDAASIGNSCLIQLWWLPNAGFATYSLSLHLPGGPCHSSLVRIPFLHGSTDYQFFLCDSWIPVLSPMAYNWLLSLGFFHAPTGQWVPLQAGVCVLMIGLHLCFVLIVGEGSVSNS